MQKAGSSIRKTFHQLVSDLQKRLSQLQKSQESLHHLISRLNLPECHQTKFHQIFQHMEALNKIGAQLLTIHNLTLFDHEYTNFCHLIICGSTMADYLSTTSSCSKAARKHALFWQQLMPQFKPFLQGILNQRNSSDQLD